MQIVYTTTSFTMRWIYELLFDQVLLIEMLNQDLAGHKVEKVILKTPKIKFYKYHSIEIPIVIKFGSNHVENELEILDICSKTRVLSCSMLFSCQLFPFLLFFGVVIA